MLTYHHKVPDRYIKAKHTVPQNNFIGTSKSKTLGYIDKLYVVGHVWKRRPPFLVV